MKKIDSLLNFINRTLVRLDRVPLAWAGVVLLVITMLPVAELGEGSVFTVHDQLDESMMNYVLTAEHSGEKTIPEMLNGINASGLQPSAVLFVPLFQRMPAFYAFLCMYGIIFLCAFLGMYLLVKELSDSSLLGAAMAGCFCMLPFYPVYGLSQMGIPLVFYAFLCLYRKKRWFVSLLLILFFGLTSHLVYTGYAVLGLATFTTAVAAVNGIRGKKQDGSALWMGTGLGLLLVTYVISNYSLFAEILLGQGDYVSHREEMVNSAMPFGKTVMDVFVSGAQHAFTYQEKLLLPIVLLLLAGAFFYRRLDDLGKKRYRGAVAGLVILFLIAVFYGICKSGPVVRFKNSCSGFLHYFQMERFYWLYPAGWYIEFGMVFSFWWTAARERAEGRRFIWACVALAVGLLPAANTILHNSCFYSNVNQYNNGSGVTGYISWKSYYAGELMGQIEDAIGRDMDTYRVAHLGISPAPALMHGFHTVDGYSNNYPLEYKHAFRKVIAAELDKSPQTAVYFDKWGNRCYLFNSLTGTYWMLEKGSGVQYEGLEFDMEALADLGCEYILSGGEILDAAQMGLEPMGYFETEDSYWGIWLYAMGTSS